MSFSSLVFLILLSAIAILDFKDMKIYPIMVWPGIAVAILLSLLNVNFSLIEWWPYALAMSVGGGFFLIQYLVSGGKWVGWGDVILGLLLGAMLGWPFIVMAIVLGYMLGAIYGSVLMILHKAEYQTPVPLGAFLCCGAIIVIFAGNEFLSWLVN